MDRTEILRRDCNDCSSKGYIMKGKEETCCEACGGSGVIEKEVPFKFDGKRSNEELAEAFEVPADQIKDAGHYNPTPGISSE